MKNKLSLLTLFISLFVSSQKRDSIIIPFPEKYELTLKHHQENEDIIFREWIPKKENFDNYSIIFTITTIKNASSVSLDLLKQSLLKDFNEKAVGAKFTEVERKLDYIIFKNEVDYYKSAPKDKESQLYFLIKGKDDLFIISVALKKKKLPEKFINEWTEVFKNSKFYQQ